MAKKKKRKDIKKSKFEFQNEMIGLILLVISILSIPPEPLGFVGRFFASFAMFLVGTSYQVLLIVTLIVGLYILIKRKWPDFFTTKLIGIYTLCIGLLVLSHLTYVLKNDGDVMIVIKETIDNLMINFSNVLKTNQLTLSGAGVIGAIFSILFYQLFAKEGTYIVAGIFIFVGGVLATGFNPIEWIKEKHKERKEENKEEKLSNTMANVRVNDSYRDQIENEEKQKNDGANPVTTVKNVNSHLIDNDDNSELDFDLRLDGSIQEDNKIKIHNISELTQPHEQVQSTENKVQEEFKPVINHYNPEYKLPSLNLITPVKKNKIGNSNQVLESNIEKLEKVLQDFGIHAKVVEVNVGPAVTQYELEISSGTKVSKILSLNREISLALAKKDVRIEAPIPGKSTVGIELANDTVMPVGLREILESDSAKKLENKLVVGLGKDIMGNSICCDIAKTPHMLVAGATGSGKSVCVNCIIASILMRTKPDEVKLMLVDPKKVELSMYNGIPHLLMPVVTDPKKANEALKRIVREMEQRYDYFSEKNVKNIAGYNAWVDKQNESLGPDDEKIPHMYYIVVIVDELADLMLVASKEVEDSIMRITQMARAAGIHLIVATQRPSTDVITGVVKANIPSRISFAVSSQIDSRTILDASGAEKLLGKGDMLFLPMGSNSPTRVQGAYVSDEDLEKIVAHTIEQQKAEYDERFMNLEVSSNQENATSNMNNDEEVEYDDPLYNDIVEFVITTGKASASLLQRRFKLGYNRAARIIDLLEERGIIGPQNGSKPREVLVKLEEE